MSVDRSTGPIARTVKAFMVGFGCGFLAFQLLNTAVGEKWTLCMRDCDTIVRVGKEILSDTYGTPGISAASERSVFSTINNTNSCPIGYLRILVLILTDPKGTDRRNVVRSTWLKDTTAGQSNYLLKWKFLIGTKNLSSSTMEALDTEQTFFHDLLFLPDLIDAYTNLTRKVLMSMMWANTIHEEYKYDFIVKTDDDSYVLLDKLALILRKLNCDERLYWGYFTGHSLPQRTGRWAETRYNICPNYMPYAMGGGYVMSKRVVYMIARHADRLMLYNNEDVSTGSWLAPYKLVRKHDLRFDVESHKHGCNNKNIISHKQLTRKDMEDKFNSLSVNGTLCIREKEIRPAYIYDWTVLPMECCERKKNLTMTVSDVDP